MGLDKPTDILQNKFFREIYLNGVIPMDGYDIKLKRADLLGLLTKNDGMAEILTDVINQVLEAQCAEQLQADRYERTEDRQAYRDLPVTVRDYCNWFIYSDF